MAWKGRDNDKQIYWSSFDAGNQKWAQQASVPGGTTAFGPALASMIDPGRKGFVAWRGKPGDEILYVGRFRGRDWETEAALPDFPAGARVAPAEV